MLMPELQQLANSLGITSIGRMRKSELITAIQAQQSKNAAQPTLPEAKATPDSTASTPAESDTTTGTKGRRATRAAGPPQPRRSAVVAAETDSGTATATATTVPVADNETSAPTERTERRRERTRRTESDGVKSERNDRSERSDQRGSDRQSGGDQSSRGNDQNGRSRGRDGRESSDEDGRRRNRRHRDRDRRGSRNRERGSGGEPQVSEDDVLVPVAGIVDILDNYAFLRTTGYLAGPTDVYVSMSQVRKHGLRRGDAVTGMVKAPKEDEGNGGAKRREKYNPLIRLDTVNGTEPDQARKRPDFYKLTPLYPQQRLRLETEPHLLTTRVIDLVAPIGKGQRALIVSPPKAGKTMVMQAIANAITTNNPECHLMVVLVDERPEEVTDMQRSVKGEVISSTFDRHPSDHTTVAELSIERAKRLVELGHDVVVLLDGITRLGRAYNNATPASGRIMSGGIDATALYPPKRFLGAARNIENGGSLTIIATALVETGSMGDTVIFEEFKGTGNSELKLDRKLADKRTYPAVDVHQSSTRRDDLMMGGDEAAIMLKLRRVLGSLDPQQAIELLLEQLKKNKTNSEFLMQIAKNTPGGD
ncbi:MAG TPA: transcription termination factor Rho [Candidatus Stackebrandtia excrementipullorum]|nr:transcription termination factor Rho [Candidatus Stackebrandtia excrementipullorum]